MSKKKLVVLSGAGISAESGISTFRDANGLWEGHDVMEVASPKGWHKNPALVLDFYNQRRAQLHTVEPNLGHKTLAELENHFDVQIITQNVDNLHERAGSSNVLHLHGELFKVRSIQNEDEIYNWTKDLNIGDTNDKGHQLRPHIVWFGEMVPMLEPAALITSEADIFIVVGTSMVVYPAASLIDFVDENAPKFVVDPNIPEIGSPPNTTFIDKTATEGLPELAKELIEKYA